MNDNMKAHALFAAFLGCSLLLFGVSCSDETVTLSPMTEELVAKYIEAHQDLIKEDDLLFLSSFQGPTKIYLSIWWDGDTNYSDELWPFSPDNYVGKTIVKDKEVLVFGPVKTMFYESNISHPRTLGKEYWCEYDADIWHICFRPDTTYSAIHTLEYSYCGDDNIEDVSSIVLRYYPESNREDYYLKNEEFFLPGSFALGEYAFETILDRLIEKYQFTGRIAVALRISQNGTVSIREIGDRLPMADQYIKAKKIVEEICKYKFEPATFRGVKVNSYFSFEIDNVVQEQVAID